MRLFAAVVPTPEALDHLARAVDGGGLGSLRPVPRPQWHVTVAFFGDVPDRTADELVDRLARAAGRTAPFAIRLRGAGTFPKQAMRGRQLWVGVDGEVAALARLSDRAAAAARRCGLAMEDRPYRAHLTLGRSRGGPADMRPQVAALTAYDGPAWTVDTLRLVHSTLGAQVVHRTWHDFPLTGTTG